MIGVIGGSGLYEMEGLEQVERVRLQTPFGDPSDEFITGVLNGVQLAFLPRHGRGHRHLPSEVNYRANIYGMKTLGVERIISVSAVGSLKEAIVPGHIVIPDQFIDRTRGLRRDSFFGEGIVAHAGFADPTCACLSNTCPGRPWVPAPRYTAAAPTSAWKDRLFPAGLNHSCTVAWGATSSA